jgi:solute carrier family 25 S-adenosylmethionine transporter 26
MAEGGVHALYSGLGVSIAREIPFAFIQFPTYEALKRLTAPADGSEGSPWRGPICGSVAGSVAAAITTPLDLLKTRQMLGHARGGPLSEIQAIIRQDGVAALFGGLWPRVGWMALGGFIFFGVYEQCVQALMTIRYDRRGRDQGRERVRAATPRTPTADHTTEAPATSSPGPGLATAPSPSQRISPPPPQQPPQPLPVYVGLLAGGMAGVVIEGALYPIDTYKTRSIQGLGLPQNSPLPAQIRYAGSLWRGIGAAIAPAMPASAAFFCTYEAVKNVMGSEHSACHFVAAAVAEASSCVVRVPAELVKMKMQSAVEAPAGGPLGLLTTTWRQGGLRSIYRGLAATLCLDLPFALLQFPLYEHLRHKFARLRLGHVGAPPEATDGAAAGAVAGAVAAFFTTPLDVIRTRHVLWPEKPAAAKAGEGVAMASTSANQRHLWTTVTTLHRSEGLAGFWRGVAPRTVYMGLGGLVYLGTYSYCSEVLMRVFSSAGNRSQSRREAQRG